MAEKRIIAHFMHEHEREAARPRMSDVQETDSYLMGRIDEADIPGLESRGLVIQALKDEPRMETAGAESEPIPGCMRMCMLSESALSRADEPAIDQSKPNFYIVQLTGPLLEPWRAELEGMGVSLLEYIPENAYRARLTPDQAADVSALDYVQQTRVYGVKETGLVMLEAAAPPPAEPGIDRAREMQTYDVRLHREEDLQDVMQWLSVHGVGVAGAKGRKVRLYAMEGSPIVDEIANLPAVQLMETYVPPKLSNDVARKVLGIDPGATTNPGPGFPFTGDGEIVAVADTGIDDAHQAFQGRIVGKVALGRAGDWSDPNGHGTHVAGSVLGDGTVSQTRIQGTAPKAKLFFQSLLDPQGGLRGLPLSLGDLFKQAYEAGARIHNNSWGAATKSMYTVSSIEVDEFVAERRDMLILIAAGNEGQSNMCLNADRGCVDWLSIGSPASCKNALTVGASRSSRTDGALSHLTWGEGWPKNFPDPPIAKEKISGDPEALAAFSSRGPCDDRRIKPDVVAPGTDIASAKSSKAPLSNYWGPYPNTDKYAYNGGTSMATPLVAGCAALVREYYVKKRGCAPSAALLKATLINGTKRLTAKDATAGFPELPNFNQGFGMIYLPWTVPTDSDPSFKLEYVDGLSTPALQFKKTGDRFQFQFSASGGERLRICLAWTDLPGRALQNNLNLFVQHVQSGKKWLGNEHLPMGLHIPDPDNNVETVRLDPPTPGDYIIQVTATNLLKKDQDFALVVTGELTSGLARTL